MTDLIERLRQMTGRHDNEAADALEAKDREIAALRELLRGAQYLLSIPDTQLPMMELNQWAQRTNAALAPAKAQP